MDDDGLLRLVGRLENVNIGYNQKHLAILHKENRLTQLIVKCYHDRHLHASITQLQYLLSLRFLIPNVIHVIKQTVHECTSVYATSSRTVPTING